MIRQRRSSVLTGVGLGLLLVLQFFIGTEALSIMVMTAALGILIAAVLRSKVRGRMTVAGPCRMAEAIDVALAASQ